MTVLAGATRRLWMQLSPETNRAALARIPGPEALPQQPPRGNGQPEAQWVNAAPATGGAGLHPWDEAHRVVANPAAIELWKKVKAVRHALFSSADKSRPEGEAWFGQGLLRAQQALTIPFRSDLLPTLADEVSFRWLRLLGALEAAPEAAGRDLMHEVEALQIHEQSLPLQQLTGGADPSTDQLDAATRKRLIADLRDSPLASHALRQHLRGLHVQL